MIQAQIILSQIEGNHETLPEGIRSESEWLAGLLEDYLLVQRASKSTGAKFFSGLTDEAFERLLGILAKLLNEVVEQGQAGNPPSLTESTRTNDGGHADFPCENGARLDCELCSSVSTCKRSKEGGAFSA